MLMEGILMVDVRGVSMLMAWRSNVVDVVGKIYSHKFLLNSVLFRQIL